MSVRNMRLRLSLAMFAAAACDTRPAGRAAGERDSCSGSFFDSRSVDFTNVDLGADAYNAIPSYDAPEFHVVVRTADDWQFVWPRVAGALPLPPVRFQDSVLILVASRVQGAGPFELKIESVRRCRRDSSLVVFIRPRTSEKKTDMLTRLLRAVEIPRSSIGAHPVRFVVRDTVID